MATENLLPTPENLTLIEIGERFNTDEKAITYLETILWSDGPVCPHCSNTEKVWKIKANAKAEVRVGLHECGECKKQFRVTVGTIFEDSKIPLRKWLIAFYMICSSKKGVSSLQLQRQLGLGSYRTALFMTHRIRYALKSESFTAKLASPVEVDETYVGGKVKGKGRHYMGNKQTVVSIVSRKGEKRSFHMPKVNAANLKEAITEHVTEGSTVMTDESKLYKKVGHAYVHETVNHSKKEYARGATSTNTVESSFALIKRGVYGTFHNISKKHLHLYLAEFDHRWNTRKDTDGQRTVKGIKKVAGRRLMLKEPTAKK